MIATRTHHPGQFVTAMAFMLCAVPHLSAQTEAGCSDDRWCLNVVEVTMSRAAEHGDIESYKRQEDLGNAAEMVKTEFYAKAWGSQKFRFSALDMEEAVDPLNERLSDRGMRSKEADMARKGIPLRAHITDLDFQFVKGGLFRFRLDVNWSLKDQVSDADMWRFNSRVIMSDLVQEEEVGYMANFNQALAKALDEALADPELPKALVRYGPLFSKTYAGWDVLEMRGPVNAPAKISEATRGVLVVSGNGGTCSGLAISSDGYLLTSTAVINDEVDTVTVRTNDGAVLKGKVIRSNELAHMALVKVEALPYVLRMDTSRTIGLGDPIFAIGTPTDKDLAQTITRGILSGERVHEGLPLLQTDARLSLGHRGGPLTDESGAVIGVIVGKFVGRSIEGLGFAVPIGRVVDLMRIRLPH